MKRFFVLPVLIFVLLATAVQVSANPGTGNQVYIPLVSFPNAVAPAKPVIAPAVPSEFLNSVTNQQPGVVVGIHVPGIFSLPVLQQPEGQPAYVSEKNNIITQFGITSAYNNIGLLAHNYLSGKEFFKLKQGQDVVVVYGDRKLETYRVVSIQRYQALEPNSYTSDFIDLDDPNQTRLTSGELFNRVYTKGDYVVFQTCIAANGNASWGRLFILAEKVS